MGYIYMKFVMIKACVCYIKNNFLWFILIVQSLLFTSYILIDNYPENDNNIIKAIDKVKPSVVGINVKQIKRNKISWNPFFNSYLDTYKVDNLGSGVIITSDGYVITNLHVVEDASDNSYSNWR